MNAIPRTGRTQKLLQNHSALLLISSRKEPDFCAPDFLFIEEIHHRAETITPLLKEMLDFRPPPHWNQECVTAAAANDHRFIGL